MSSVDQTVPAAALPSAATPAAAAAAPPVRTGLTGSAALPHLTEQDWHLIRLQHSLKQSLPERPKQTGFRVFAILTYTPEEPLEDASSAAGEDLGVLTNPHPYDRHQFVEGSEGKLAYVTGTNTEPCFIGNSICAERTALLQMRMKRYKSIEKLFITADADSIITPGLLCRELMCEFLALDTPLIFACRDVNAHNGFQVQLTSLRQIYPFPPLYLNTPGSTVAEFCKHFHSTSDKFAVQYENKQEWMQLYRKVVDTTEKDARTGLHPLRFAAGVLFTDGSSRCVAMNKLLEFGWSLDAIVKLVPYLEEKREQGVEPALILLSDQFGNLHAPSAPARAHLGEYRYRPTLIFHDRAGKLHEVSIDALTPDTPDDIEDVLPNTVTQSAASAHACAGTETPHTH